MKKIGFYLTIAVAMTAWTACEKTGIDAGKLVFDANIQRHEKNVKRKAFTIMQSHTLSCKVIKI